MKTISSLRKGISVGEEVYLSLPENVEKFVLAGKDLIPEIKEIEAKRKRG